MYTFPWHRVSNLNENGRPHYFRQPLQAGPRLLVERAQKNRASMPTEVQQADEDKLREGGEMYRALVSFKLLTLCQGNLCAMPRPAAYHRTKRATLARGQIVSKPPIPKHNTLVL